MAFGARIEERLSPAMRIGTGFDIHRLNEGGRLVLGGVHVEAPFGALGHSDGDALLHAVIDALLGAAGRGDIGERFPDTDERWRDADSSELLGMVVAEVKAAGYEIANIDATVFLQEPKLGRAKSAMAVHIARVAGLGSDAVSVKAKTMEGLGPVGEGRAVAAQAAVLLT